MRLTTRGRYAVTAMLDLALHGDRGPVPLSDIAARQDISLAYLEQLFARLRRRGLVSSVRGPGGGYRLALAEEDISIAVVIDAVDESLDATRCGGAGNCQDGERCLTHDLWSDLSERVHAFLGGITLASLVRGDGTRAVAARQDARARDPALIRAATI
ncbi:MAG TPA: Fe-S cluster assembly transcription factor [Pseudomonadales bacterium]|nr:Fe-S cluster assembly transcription factor [Pseudomonadales bacterium]